MEFLELKALVYAAPEPFRTREHIWHRYLGYLQPKQVALEFGVWRGRSINYMARVRPENVFRGYDSFKGLAEDWIEGRPKGYFAVTDRAALKFERNVIIHDGEFEKTLPNVRIPNAKLFHIDCDTGPATETVFKHLGQTMIDAKGILLFDEFYNYHGFEHHEMLAFLNFINRTGALFRVIGRNTEHQQVLIELL